MFENSTFWVFVSFVIFFALVWRAGVFTKATHSLDERSAKIAKDLEDARQLRLEAESLLKEYEAKRKAVEVEAKAILDAAKADAKRLAEETEAKLTDFVARRSAAAEAKIAMAEAQAYADVRSAAADAAVHAAETVLRGDFSSGKPAEKLLKSGLDDVMARLN
jgi:F-type H+-transporting ATPase subunit b